MAPNAIALSSAAGGGAGLGASLEHAKLMIFDPRPADGGAATGALRGQISFQFNPKELSITKAAKWERKPARNAKAAGPPEFKGADPAKMTIEMFFNAASPTTGVAAIVEQLFALCVPTAESHDQQKASPPLVQLRWGKVTSFPAYVASVTAKYTLFAPDGTPLRALCQVAMEEMPGDWPNQNPTSGGITAHRVHTVVAGDSLQSVAFRAYGDPNAWRAVAAANGIDDPMRLRLGSQLKLPGPAELEL
jgi:nucleoid-associated protein YgaU